MEQRSVFWSLVIFKIFFVLWKLKQFSFYAVAKTIAKADLHLRLKQKLKQNLIWLLEEVWCFLFSLLDSPWRSLYSIYKSVCSINIYSILDRPYQYVSGINWDYVWNGLWCIVAIMTTVGYGELYPKTHLGRLIGIIAAVIGAFLVSLMVVAMSNSSSLSSAEERVNNFHEKAAESNSNILIKGCYEIH